jgi:hypothetical protein
MQGENPVEYQKDGQLDGACGFGRATLSEHMRRHGCAGSHAAAPTSEVREGRARRGRLKKGKKCLSAEKCKENNLPWRETLQEPSPSLSCACVCV